MSWAIAAVRIRCQRCARPIEIGEPFRILRVGAWTRCRDCARQLLGELPPADLKPPAAPPVIPPVAEFETVSELFHRISGQLPFDVKRAQTGEADE